MNNSGASKYLNNQAIGILPVLLMILISGVLGFKYALSASIGLSLIIFLIYRLIPGHRVCQFMVIPSTLSLVLLGILYFIPPVQEAFRHNVTIIMEMLFVLLLSITTFSKRRISPHLRSMGKKASHPANFKMAYSDFFKLSVPILTIYYLHIFFVVVMYISGTWNPIESKNRFAISILPVILGLSIILFEHIRLVWVCRLLRREEWIPIVDPCGKPCGRIAKAISNVSFKHYTHPIVRLIVTEGNRILLKERPENVVVCAGKIDTPFYAMKLVGELDTITLQRIIEDAEIKDLISVPHYLLRFEFENKDAKRFVSLYNARVNVASPERFPDTAKFWTQQEIEANLGKGIFSDYFEREYPYLKSTILLAACITMGEKEVTNTEEKPTFA